MPGVPSRRDATEHTTGDATELATETDKDVTFVNIDWKRARHATVRAETRNFKKLFATVQSVVQNQKPSILCLCEVGEVHAPLSKKNFESVAETCTRAWLLAHPPRAASERPDLKVEYTLNACYMTIWDAQRVQCLSSSISSSLSFTHPFRKAQLLEFEIKQGHALDIVNVHSPSSTRNPLSDAMRREVLASILVTPTRSHGGAFGHGACLIGGDMNTKPELFTVLLDDVLDDTRVRRARNLLQSDSYGRPTYKFHGTPAAKHGDLVVCFNVAAEAARKQAVNHDKQHDPVGIRVKFVTAGRALSGARGSSSSSAAACSSPAATEQHAMTASPPPPAGHAVQTPASGSASSSIAAPAASAVATEPCASTQSWRWKAAANADAPVQTPPPSTSTAGTAVLDSRLANEPLQKETGATERRASIEERVATIHQVQPPSPQAASAEANPWDDYHKLHQSPEDAAEDRARVAAAAAAEAAARTQIAQGMAVAVPLQSQTDASERRVSIDEGAVTIHSDPDEATSDSDRDDRPPMDIALYCSITLLLWNASLHSPYIEDLIQEVCVEAVSGGRVLTSLENIFQPFFLTPRDPTAWEPKDPRGLLDKLAWYASFRDPVVKKRGRPTDSATERIILTEAEVKECFQNYVDWFRAHEATEEQQEAKNMRNMAGARIHREIGNKYAAFAAWEVGMPLTLRQRFPTSPPADDPSTATERALPTCERDGVAACYQGSRSSIPEALLQSMLSDAGMRVLKNHIKDILAWLTQVAESIAYRKATTAYQEQQERPGQKNQSPLDPQELELRRREKLLYKDIALAGELDRRWDPSAEWDAYSEKEAKLLWRYWKGYLHEELRQLRRQPRDKGPRRLTAFRVT